MTVNNVSYPYPVLGNADDITGDFSWEAAYKMSDTEVLITAKLLLNNGELKELIARGEAKFALRIECPLTYYRETFVGDGEVMEIPLAAGAVRDTVIAAPFVVAVSKLERYAPKSAHKDYSGSKFNIAEGGILAFGPKASFIAAKEFVGAKRRIQSIMEVVRHTKEGADPEYKLSNDKIEIYLNSKDWDVYQAAKLRPDARNIVHAAVVFPVLLEALEHLDDDDYTGRPWRDRLVVLLQEKGLSDEPSRFKQAMGLLKNPISRGFDGLAGLFNSQNAAEVEDDE